MRILSRGVHPRMFQRGPVSVATISSGMTDSRSGNALCTKRGESSSDESPGLHLEIDSRHWIDRVPARYRDQAPRLVRQADGSEAWNIGDKIVRPAAAADLYGGKGRDEYVPFGGKYEGTPGTGSPEQRLQEQDRDGIDAEVLFPSQQGGPKFWRRIEDDAAYKAIVRAYNSWLAEEYCTVDADRLIGGRHLAAHLRMWRMP